MRSQKESKYLTEAKQLEIKEDESYSPYVIMSYLLNPFCVMNCVGQTTTVFGNLISAISIFSMLKGDMKDILYRNYDYEVKGTKNHMYICALHSGYRLICGISLALAAYQSLYPISLIFPAVICIYDKEVKKYPGTNWKISLVKTTLAFLLPLAAFLLSSKELCNSWNFLDQTYGFM